MNAYDDPIDPDNRSFDTSDSDTSDPLMIRPAVLGDADRLAALLRELGEFSSVTREAPDVTLARIRAHLAVIGASDSHTLLVAEAGEALVGYCSVHWLPMLARLEGYVSELFVARAHRGGGIGTCLLEHVKNEAKSRACERLHLENYRTKDSYVRGFYASQGWQERPAAASFVLELGAS